MNNEHVYVVSDNDPTVTGLSQDEMVNFLLNHCGDGDPNG
jgi:hypothetical protein